MPGSWQAESVAREHKLPIAENCLETGIPKFKLKFREAGTLAGKDIEGKEAKAE